MPTSLDRTLAALADPTRRGAVDLLRARPRAAGELAAALHMSAPAMSRHLRVLRLKGLVEEEHLEREDARLRVYRLRRQPFIQLSHWAAGLEALWRDQLDGFKEYVEGGRKGRQQ